MTQAPFEVYPKQLASKKNGYALWRPDPGNEPAVEIGDVGYVERGKFIRIFNASKPQDDESNQLGVPDGYYPLQVGKIVEDTISADFPIMSENVTQLGAELEAAGGVAGAGFSFNCAKEQGAVLILQGDADVRDAFHKKAFLRYIRNNYQAWLAFANERHQRLITLNDLVLVTGCDKTSAWACATFSGSSKEISVKFIAGQGGLLQGSAGIWASWDTCQSIQGHSGPRITRPVLALQPPRETKSIYASGTRRRDLTVAESIIIRLYMLIALILHHTFHRPVLSPRALTFNEREPPITGDSDSNSRQVHADEPDSRAQQSASGAELRPSRRNSVSLGHDSIIHLENNEHLPRNQCVFVRGFKLLDRSTWSQKLRLKKQDLDGFEYFARKGSSDSSQDGGSNTSGRRGSPSGRDEGSGNSGKNGSSGPSNGGRNGNSGGLSKRFGRRSESSGGSRSLGSSTTYGSASKRPDEGALDDAIQLHRDMDLTPLDIILEYIIENSTAELAIVHDDDLINSFPNSQDFDDLRARIRETAPKIYVERQVGMLENTHQISVSVPTDARFLSKTEIQEPSKNISPEQSDNEGFSIAPSNLVTASSDSISAAQVSQTDRKGKEQMNLRRKDLLYEDDVYFRKKKVLLKAGLSLKHMICGNSKSGYCMYSGVNLAEDSLPIVVRVYQGDHSKERWLIDVALNERLWNPSLLQFVEKSEETTDPAFVVYSGNYQAPVQDLIASSLSTDAVRSIGLAFQTISSISLALGYLSSEDVSLSSIGVKNFDILVDVDDRVQIAFTSSISGEQEHEPNSTSNWKIFNDLTHRTFSAVNAQIDHVPPKQLFEWQPQEEEPSILDHISHEYLIQLVVSSPTSSGHHQVQTRARSKQKHICGCGRPFLDDIFLITDIFPRNTPSHSTPKFRAVCVRCGNKRVQQLPETAHDCSCRIDKGKTHAIECSYHTIDESPTQQHPPRITRYGDDHNPVGGSNQNGSQGSSRVVDPMWHVENSRVRCHSCQTQVAVEFQRGFQGTRTLCNACELLYKAINGDSNDEVQAPSAATSYPGVDYHPVRDSSLPVFHSTLCFSLRPGERERGAETDSVDPILSCV